MDVLFLLALALAPGAAIGLYIYLKDKHEREPLGLLMRSFFFWNSKCLCHFVNKQGNRHVHNH